MLVLGVFCLALAAAVLCRDIPIGRSLRHALIEAPAERLSRWTFAKVLTNLFVFIMIGAAVALALTLQDGLMIWMMLPEVLAWVVAVDAATFLELSIAVWLTSANVRVSAFGTAARVFVVKHLTSVTRAWRAKRAVRSRRSSTRTRAGPRKDEPDGSLGWALAA